MNNIFQYNNTYRLGSFKDQSFTDSNRLRIMQGLPSHSIASQCLDNVTTCQPQSLKPIQSVPINKGLNVPNCEFLQFLRTDHT